MDVSSLFNTILIKTNFSMADDITYTEPELSRHLYVVVNTTNTFKD